MIDHVHKPELTHKPVAVDPTEIDLTGLMLTVDRKDRLVDDTLEDHGDHRGILLTARDPRQTESKDPLERCAYEIPREGKDVDKGLVVDRQRLTAAQLNLVSTELTIDGARAIFDLGIGLFVFKRARSVCVVRGRVGLTDRVSTVGGNDPEIGTACVKDDLEGLWGCSDTDLSIITCGFVSFSSTLSV